MSRHLEWDGCFNARDLGGLGKVRRGALVRADALDALSAAGWAALEAHGVRTVVDLRNPEEYLAEPVPPPAGVTVLRLPLDGTHDRAFWDVWEKTPAFGTPLYYQPHLERFPERSAAVLSALARAAPGGVAFHCAGGRDRTGQIAMLVLAILGASAAEIGADYVLSYERLPARYRLHAKEDTTAALHAYMASRGTTYEQELTRILMELDVESLLRAGGVTDEDFAALRARASACEHREARPRLRIASA